MQEQFDKLKAAVDAVGEDIQKAATGNKAAGTRVRKQMQEVKKLAQEVRRVSMDASKSE